MVDHLTIDVHVRTTRIARSLLSIGWIIRRLPLCLRHRAAMAIRRGVFIKVGDQDERCLAEWPKR